MLVATVLATVLWSPPGFAEKALVTHDAPATAPQGEPLELTLRIARPRAFKRARLRYRVAGDAAFRKADFSPSGKRRTLSATIPADALTPAGIEYLVVVQSKKGRVSTPYGTATKPLKVRVFVAAGRGDDGTAEEVAGDERAGDDDGRDDGSSDTSPKGERAEGRDAPANGDQSRTDEGSATGNAPEGDVVAEDTAPSSEDEGASADGRTPDDNARDDAASGPNDAGDDDASGDVAQVGKPAPSAELPSAPRATEGPRVVFGAGQPGDPLAEELAVYAAEAPDAFYREEVVAERRPMVRPHVMTRSEIERLPVRTLADIIKLFPGFETHVGVLGNDRLTVRGVRGLDRTVLLIDGVRVENPVDSSTYLFIPATLIEEVRVYPRPALDALGPGGRAARIEVITHRRDGLFAEAFGSTFIGGGAGVAGGWSFDNVRMHGSAHVQGDLGPREAVSEDRYTDTAYERPPEDSITSAQNVRGGANVRVEGDVGPATLYAAATTLAEWRGPYIGVFDTLGEDSRLIGTQSHVAAGASADVLGFLELGVDAYVLHALREENLQLTPKSFSTPDRDGDGVLEPFPDGVTLRRGYNALTLGTQAHAVVRAFTGNVLVAQTEARLGFVPPGGYALHANRDSAGLPQSLGPVEGLPVPQAGPCTTAFGVEIGLLGACRGTLAGSISDSQTLFNMIRIGAGLRIVGYSDVGFDFLSSIQPHIGAELLLFDQWTLYGTLQTGNRAPSFEQRVDQSAQTYLDLSRGAFVGNPDLRVESFRMFEWGTKGSATVSGADLQASGAFFAMQNGAAIEAIPVNGIVETVQNAGDLYTTGLEATVKANFNGLLPGDAGGSFAFANLSWFRGVFHAPLDLDTNAVYCDLLPAFGVPLSDGAAPPCSLITNVPQLRANLGVLWDAGVFGAASATVSLGSERRNNARSTLERLRAFSIPGYALLNASYRSAALFDVVGVFVEGYNILDTDPKDDVPRPDRMVDLLPREGVSVLGGVYLKL